MKADLRNADNGRQCSVIDDTIEMIRFIFCRVCFHNKYECLFFHGMFLVLVMYVDTDQRYDEYHAHDSLDFVA